MKNPAFTLRRHIRLRRDAGEASGGVHDDDDRGPSRMAGPACAAWKDTRDTLHPWTQIVGKVRPAQMPCNAQRMMIRT